MEVSLYKISLTTEEMDKIQNKIDQRMKNLYYKSMWKPKVGDKVSELFYPENGIGTIIDLSGDSWSVTALVKWEANQEYIETRHLSLILDEDL
jgi:hypothetical protein